MLALDGIEPATPYSSETVLILGVTLSSYVSLLPSVRCPCAYTQARDGRCLRNTWLVGEHINVFKVTGGACRINPKSTTH
ncbi:hypothetical protein DLJ82_6319 (plasmid) [Rhizobium leguminosarum]|uniref:Uncharacterized protein n=1 Tax=Rhizobium leguminosarum TaxID=384 RepID=A0A2Z4YSF3_RHILE|nr:hypothetical protein DLJ82_6319 [Rhizobium leguminosarum]